MYAINLLIESTAPLAYGILPPQTYIYKRIYSYLLSYLWFKWLTFLQIAHFLSRKVYHVWAPLGSGMDESATECN